MGFKRMHKFGFCPIAPPSTVDSTIKNGNFMGYDTIARNRLIFRWMIGTHLDFFWVWIDIIPDNPLLKRLFL